MVAQDFRMEMELLRADSKGSRAVNTSWASWRGYIEGQLVRVQEQAEKITGVGAKMSERQKVMF